MVRNNHQRRHIIIHQEEHLIYLQRTIDMAKFAARNVGDEINRGIVIRPVRIDGRGNVHINRAFLANGGAERADRARYLYHRVRLPGIPLGPIVQEEEQFIPEPDPEQFLFDEEVIPILEEEVVQEVQEQAADPIPAIPADHENRPNPELSDYSFFADYDFPSDLFDDE